MGANRNHRKEVRTHEKEQLFMTRTTAALGLSMSDLQRLLSPERQSAVRINPLAGRSKQAIFNDLQKLKVDLEPIGWAEDAYFMSDKTVVTQSALFERGEVYVQTASSLIPGIALAPQAGERVLDLCAAPGGKACHIASLANGYIELYVNDAFKPRIKKLNEVLAWQNVQPASVTQYPAQYADKFMEHEYYDRILLDAQCTGEGRVDLSNPAVGLQYWSLKRVREYSRLQQRMLRSAYKLLKPGGTLVYSTCTIAPEENEIPVDHLLRHTNAVIEPFTLGIPEAKPGLTTWEKAKLDPTLSGALRIMPSLKMEAFFVCCIGKPVSVDSGMALQ